MMKVTMTRARVLSGVCAASGVVALAATGCSTYVPGGSGFSDDAYTYPSTPQTPQTVTLTDTRTGQTLWTYEIPVGRQLTVRFMRDSEPENVLTPDTMYWEEMDAGTHYGYLDNSMLVPNRDGRRLDPMVRPAPEMPTAAAPGAGQ